MEKKKTKQKKKRFILLLQKYLIHISLLMQNFQLNNYTVI